MAGGKVWGGIGRGCARVGRCLIDQSAALYIALYLLSILAFALLYCLLPAEAFHAPFVAREPQTAESDNAFEPFIMERMRRSAETWSGTNYVSFSMSDVSILRISADAARSTVRVAISYKLDNHPQQAAAIDIDMFTMPAGGDACHTVRLVPEESSPEAATDGVILDILFRDTPGCASAHYLRLNTDDETVFRNYALGISGRAKYLHYYGLRMIEFSAMTITTTGDGALVPTMRSARMAVAFEPLWGLFLIGLALRAVVRKVRVGAA